MSEPMVSTQSAIEQLRRADQRWEAAIRAFDDYPTRLRALADAADLRSRALTLAHLANITGKARPGAGSLRSLAFELSAASNRPGPGALWRRFDQTVREIGQTLESGEIQLTAQAFSALSTIARDLADACQAETEQPARPRKSA
jgi:hypothetical protein